MRSRYLSSVLLLALAAPMAWAAPSPDPGLVLQPQSRLWVEGTSTVRGFTCKASTLEAEVAAAPEAVGLVLGGEKAVSGAEIRVPARKLDCGNGTMNDHMYKAIKADANPTIVFRLGSYELAPAGEGMTVKITGQLSLGGTQRTITLDAQAREGANGTLRVDGTEEILLSEFGLKAPSLMMGTMKVQDRVKVGFELVLKP